MKERVYPMIVLLVDLLQIAVYSVIVVSSPGPSHCNGDKASLIVQNVSLVCNSTFEPTRILFIQAALN